MEPSRNTARSTPLKPAPGLAEGGVLLTDLSLKPIAYDRGAASILKECAPQRDGQEPALSLPEEIRAVLRNGGRDTGVKTYVHIGKCGYLCRAYVIEGHNGSGAAPMLALHLQRELPIPQAVYELAAEYGLTHREREALAGIAMGLTSKELAEKMNISPNTVKTFIRLITLKLGVTRRAAIVGKLLVHNGAPNGASS